MNRPEPKAKFTRCHHCISRIKYYPEFKLVPLPNAHTSSASQYNTTSPCIITSTSWRASSHLSKDPAQTQNYFAPPLGTCCFAIAAPSANLLHELRGILILRRVFRSTQSLAESPQLLRVSLDAHQSLKLPVAFRCLTRAAVLPSARPDGVRQVAPVC